MLSRGVGGIDGFNGRHRSVGFFDALHGKADSFVKVSCLEAVKVFTSQDETGAPGGGEFVFSARI
jgi:hypothetical protein